MGSEADSPKPDVPLRLQIDFQQARRQIERLEQYQPPVRARALATYVGLFDLAADDGSLNAASRRIAEDLQITRVSFLQYRKVLEDAGLVTVTASRGRHTKQLQLLGPTS